MDDLSRKLTEVLEDPSRMQQIMNMAASLGLQPPTEQAEGTPKDNRQESLVRALMPYLHPRRQARLQRVMELTDLTRLAGAAFRSLPTQQKEGEELV